MRGHFQKPLIVAALMLCGGCASTEPNASSFTVRRAGTHNTETVFDAAAASLVERGFRIDLAQKLSGRLTTYPMESYPAADTGRFGAAKTDRRLAEVRIDQTEGEATVYCRVLIQRQTTEAHRLLALDASGDDRPQQTPIEREAATVRTQNTVWQTVGRDRQMERAIVAEILEKLPKQTTTNP